MYLIMDSNNNIRPPYKSCGSRSHEYHIIPTQNTDNNL